MRETELPSEGIREPVTVKAHLLGISPNGLRATVRFDTGDDHTTTVVLPSDAVIRKARGRRYDLLSTEQPKDALSGNDAIWLEQIASTADETEYDGNRSLWPEDVENLKRIAALLRPKQAVGDVYDEIRAERRHQDEKWGGEAHDDEHGANDWLDIIDRLTSEYDHGEDARKVLLQIAAVAVAAIETRDRAAQRG